MTGEDAVRIRLRIHQEMLVEIEQKIKAIEATPLAQHPDTLRWASLCHLAEQQQAQIDILRWVLDEPQEKTEC